MGMFEWSNSLLFMRYWFDYVIRPDGNVYCFKWQDAKGTYGPFDPPIWAGHASEICNRTGAATMSDIMYMHLKKGLTMTPTESETAQRQAYLDGQKFAHFLLWLKGPGAANIPMDIAMDECIVRANMLGHNENRAFVQFIAGFNAKMSDYRSANSSVRIAAPNLEHDAILSAE